MLPEGASCQLFWDGQSFGMCGHNEMMHFMASLG